MHSWGRGHKDEGKAFAKGQLQGFRLASLGHGRRAYNMISGNASAMKITIFDFLYIQGSGKSSNSYNQTAVLFISDRLNIPKFKMRPENVFHRIGSSFGMQDIDFEEYPIFSKQYLLQGEDEKSVRRLFGKKLLNLFTEKDGLCVEGQANRLIIYRNGKRVSPEKITDFLNQQLAIANTFMEETASLNN